MSSVTRCEDVWLVVLLKAGFSYASLHNTKAISELFCDKTSCWHTCAHQPQRGSYSFLRAGPFFCRLDFFLLFGAHMNSVEMRRTSKISPAHDFLCSFLRPRSSGTDNKNIQN
jgi:hypothetical protein